MIKIKRIDPNIVQVLVEGVCEDAIIRICPISYQQLLSYSGRELVVTFSVWDHRLYMVERITCHMYYEEGIGPWMDMYTNKLN